MKKRLFIAIPLDEKWPSAFDEFQRKCKQETDKLRDFRWTKVENLHITICFLGWIEEGQVPEISQKLKEVLKNAKPFGLEFENIIFAPPKTTARMIWAAFKDNEEYKRLAKLIYEAMQEFSEEVASEASRGPIAHITLARFTDRSISKNKEMLKLFLTKDKIFHPHTYLQRNKVYENNLKLMKGVGVKVNNIQLMESKLSPSGPIYSIVENFILK